VAGSSDDYGSDAKVVNDSAGDDVHGDAEGP
jgi:hypothetical protein